MAKKANRYGVLTQQTYSNTIISESDKAGMEEFLDNMRIILGALGCEALEPLDVHSKKGDADRKFYIQIGSVSAEGEATPDGFVVFKGATLNEKVSQKSVGKKVAEKRKAMTDAGKICNFTTTEDYKYSVAEYSYYFGINCGTCICCKKVLRIHRLFCIC